MKRSLMLSLIIVAVLGINTYGTSPTDHSFLVGTWWNFDPAGDIVAFLIHEDQIGNLYIYALGNCVPSPCPWGWVPCIDYSDDIDSTLANGFMAFYDFEWKETWMMGRQLEYPRYNILEVTAFHFYFDSRFDRWDYGIFIRID